MWDLSRILGEDTLNINTNGPAYIVVPEKSMEAINKWKNKK